MKPIARITGVAAALPTANVDTDVIIRIEHLAQCPKDQLGQWCFGPLRFHPDGTENPDFIFNQSAWRGAPILMAGPNFGCGSSREHAVWALQGLGVACVIAPSFGDIFYANCYQNGLLPVVLEPAPIQSLMHFLTEAQARHVAHTFTVDLVAQTITWPGGPDIDFTIDARRREALMEGLDPLGATIKQREHIARWQAQDRQLRPWIWPAHADHAS